MFLVETNQQSKKRYENNGLKFNDFSIEYFNKQKNSFLTYFLLQDPQLREFNKYNINANFCDALVSLDTVVLNIKNISYNEVNNLLLKGGIDKNDKEQKL